jgi:hypothetical protein
LADSRQSLPQPVPPPGVAGINGIFAGWLGPGRERQKLAHRVHPRPILNSLAAGLVGYPIPYPEMPPGWGTMIVAGVFVGFGTRLSGPLGMASGIARFPHDPSRPLHYSWRPQLQSLAISRRLLGGWHVLTMAVWHAAT